MGVVVEVEEDGGPVSGVAVREDLGPGVGCVCGASHGDLAALAKRGWQTLGGDAALMVLCPCGAAVTADLVRDACLCDTCRRLVTGSDEDIKVCVVHRGANLVLCAACFRRDMRRDGWLAWRVEGPSEPSDSRLAVHGWAVVVGGRT
ncbi:MAG: hypothetical protein ACLP1X_15710 [Polyangiaceae bacterium]